MSEAEELLESLPEEDYTAGSGDAERHIVIGKDRYITVPEELKKIAVQFDHDVETVTFDCPCKWDEHELSQMKVYVNFIRSDGYIDKKLCSDPVIDEDDLSIMHFDWTISGNVTQVNGPIKFLVCIKKVDADGNEANHWNSELNEDMFVSEGLECDTQIWSANKDIITDLLLRMEKAESVLDMSWVYATDEKIEKIEAEKFDKSGGTIDGDLAVTGEISTPNAAKAPETTTVEAGYSVRQTAGGADIVDGTITRVKIIKGKSVKGEDFSGLKHAYFKSIKSTGKNLIDIPDFELAGAAGPSVDLNLSGTVTFSCKITRSESALPTSAIVRVLVDGVDKYQAPTNVDDNGVLKLTVSGSRITKLSFLNWSQTVGSVSEVMLNQGSTALPFEPYKEDTYELREAVELGEWDEIDVSAGKVVKCTKQIVFTGTEVWSLNVQASSNGWGNVYMRAIGQGALYPRVGVCSHFETGEWDTNFKAGSKNVFAATADVVLIKTDGVQTLSEFKEYLAAQYEAGTPVTIDIRLATETEEDIVVPKAYTAYDKGSEIIVQGTTDNSEFGAVPTVVQEYSIVVDPDNTATKGFVYNGLAGKVDKGETVGNATYAKFAERAAAADHATKADTANRAYNADHADHATNADFATGAGYAERIDFDGRIDGVLVSDIFERHPQAGTLISTVKKATNADAADHATNADTVGDDNITFVRRGAEVIAKSTNGKVTVVSTTTGTNEAGMPTTTYYLTADFSCYDGQTIWTTVFGNISSIGLKVTDDDVSITLLSGGLTGWDVGSVHTVEYEVKSAHAVNADTVGEDKIAFMGKGANVVRAIKTGGKVTVIGKTSDSDSNGILQTTYQLTTDFKCYDGQTIWANVLGVKSALPLHVFSDVVSLTIPSVYVDGWQVGSTDTVDYEVKLKAYHAADADNADTVGEHNVTFMRLGGKLVAVTVGGSITVTGRTSGTDEHGISVAKYQLTTNFDSYDGQTVWFDYQGNKTSVTLRVLDGTVSFSTLLGDSVDTLLGGSNWSSSPKHEAYYEVKFRFEGEVTNIDKVTNADHATEATNATNLSGDGKIGDVKVKDIFATDASGKTKSKVNNAVYADEAYEAGVLDDHGTIGDVLVRNIFEVDKLGDITSKVKNATNADHADHATNADFARSISNASVIEAIHNNTSSTDDWIIPITEPGLYAVMYSLDYTEGWVIYDTGMIFIPDVNSNCSQGTVLFYDGDVKGIYLGGGAIGDSNPDPKPTTKILKAYKLISL